MKKQTTACGSGGLSKRHLLQLLRKILITPLVLFCFAASAQQKAHVTGIVKDEKGSPVENASVVVKGTKEGATTDANGAFSLDVPSQKSTLVISNVGFQPQEILVGKTTNFSIKLNNNVNSLNEVVVVGYGTQRKVTVTGAVSQVKGSELEKTPTVNLSNSLVGRLPGLSAMQTGGEPGYDGSNIRIRGTNTFGNTSALIVVDGVPDVAGGLDRINPADVESMSILKDASAAIYGSRAANGVILVTTKHGRSGKPQLSYTYNHGWAQPTRTAKMADAAEYAQLNNETTIYKLPAAEWAAAEAAFNATGTYTAVGGALIHAPFKPADIELYKNGKDPWGHPNTNWFKTTLKTWSPQEQHSLQLRGGSENVRYLASLGYQNQDGYYKNSATGYKQYDMRVNLDADINKYITTSINLTAREEYRHFPTQAAGDIFRMLQRGRPTETEVFPNGLPGPDIENGQNPIVITTNQTGYSNDKRDYFQVNGRVEFKIPGVPGLKLTGTATVDKEIQRNKKWETPWYLYSWDKTSYEADGVTPKLQKTIRSTFTTPRLGEADFNYLNILTSGFINYDRIIGPHTIALMAAVTKETDTEDEFNAYRTGYTSSAIDQLFFGGALGQQTGGKAYERARLSYFGRAAYNYKEKYLAEFLWRADGSYLFPENKRWGFFPGILAGWRISEESFFKDNIKFVNSLKLRGSYGVLGNDQVYYHNTLQEYQFLSTYGVSQYSINNASFQTLYENVVPNLNFTWEEAKNTDIGIEGTLLNNHVNFEFDYFYNKRDKILWPQTGSTPASSGIATLLPPTNYAKAENKGYDFSVGYNGSANGFRFSVNINGGYAKNKIINFDENPGRPDWQRATGHPFSTGGVGSFLPYEYDGIFKDQKEIDANKIDYSALTPKLQPGDMKYKDIGGHDANGKYVQTPDGKIDDADQVRLDKTNEPTFTGGVNINIGYKGFDLTVLFQGATGGLLYIGTESGDIGNYLQYTYDHRWTIDNPSSVDPRVTNRSDKYFSGGNTYFLRNNNYVRLKNIELGYNLSPNMGKRAGINALRLYVSALNLATWDKMKIYDPESQSGDGHYYPQSRILNAGVRVTF